MITFDHIAHQYYIDHTPVKSVTQILKGAGLCDYSMVPPDVLQRAADFGTAVHKATELYDKDDLDADTLDPALIPYLDAWMSFIKMAHWSTTHCEQVVYSKKYLYAGTYDRKGFYNDKLTILDIKTGIRSKATIKVAGIQLSGYEIAYNENDGKNGKIKQRACVWLAGDGTFKLETYNDKADQARFLACLTIANIKEELK